VCTENLIRVGARENHLSSERDDRPDLGYWSKIRLEAESAILRRQLIVLERKIRGRVRFTSSDRLFFISLYRWFPSMLDALRIIRPETLVRWHCAGFRRYWRWKSRSAGGRPQIDAELRALIRRMSVDNPLWGAPRIHGELLKLGFAVAQSGVAKYMIKRPASPSQRWLAFLRNLNANRRYGPIRGSEHHFRCCPTS
jgi:hypothetical protein